MWKVTWLKAGRRQKKLLKLLYSFCVSRFYNRCYHAAHNLVSTRRYSLGEIVLLRLRLWNTLVSWALVVNITETIMKCNNSKPSALISPLALHDVAFLLCSHSAQWDVLENWKALEKRRCCAAGVSERRNQMHALWCKLIKLTLSHFGTVGMRKLPSIRKSFVIPRLRSLF